MAGSGWAGPNPGRAGPEFFTFDLRYVHLSPGKMHIEFFDEHFWGHPEPSCAIY